MRRLAPGLTNDRANRANNPLQLTGSNKFNPKSQYKTNNQTTTSTVFRAAVYFNYLIWWIIVKDLVWVRLRDTVRIRVVVMVRGAVRETPTKHCNCNP